MTTFPVSPEAAAYQYGILQNMASQSHTPAVARLMEAGMVYQYLLRELTKTRQQFFSSDYERLIVVLNFYPLPPKLSKALKKTGFLLGRAAKLSHTEIPLLELQKTALALCLALEHFSGVLPPPDLYDFCQPALFLPDEEDTNPYAHRQTIPLLKAVVNTVGELKSTKDGKNYFILHCTSEDYAELPVYLWNEFTYLHPLLWQYARINFTNLALQTNIDANETEKQVFAATPDTLLTLDPDYLIDVTDVQTLCLKRGVHVAMYLLKKYYNEFSNYFLLRGNLVNAFLDANLRNEEVSFKELFNQYIISNPTHALSFTNEDYFKLRAEIAPHIETIKSPLIQQFKQYDLNLEPTFISEIYGLRGRLDVLVSYPDDPHHRDVIELKTSKDPLPWRPVHEAYLIQAVSYYLLLETIDPLQKGSSSVLYSAVPPENEPLRNVTNDMKNKRAVMHLRNLIVAAEYGLTHNPATTLAQVNATTVGEQNLFDNDIKNFTDFNQHLHKCTPQEQAYFYEWTAFTAREHRAAKIGSDNDRGDYGFSGLWNMPLGFKELSFSILAYLTFNQAIPLPEKLDIEIEFDKTTYTLPVARFRLGDMVLLYPHEPDDDNTLAPTRHQIVKATIKTLTPDKVVISPLNKHIDRTYFEQFTYWAMEAETSDVGYEGMYKSMYEFIQLPPDKKNLLLGLKEPEFTPQPNPHLEPENLKPRQLSILHKALSAKNYFLLQGPPGTGKTKVMMRRLVTEILKDPHEKLILLAYTNRAVDEMCDALADMFTVPQVFRLGYGTSTEHPQLLLTRFAKENDLKTLRQAIVDCRIFIGTVLTYQRSPELRKFLENKQYTPKLTAIIDEASQLLEPQIIGILGKVDRFILIGDEKQLPAVVIQGEGSSCTQNPLLHQLGIKSLAVSLFERLLKQCQQGGWHNAYDMLEDQGRMHVHIAKFPSREYYHNRLKHVTERQMLPYPDFFTPPHHPVFPFMETLWEKRTIFIATQPQNERNRNTAEATLVKQLIEQLYPVFDPNNAQDSIGVITPYRTQIAEIKQHLHQYPAVLVDTVERYQGGQKNAIIVSLAVNSIAQLKNLHVLNEDGTVDKKLNVTLTRAKEYLIILGCPQILVQSPVYRQLINHYRQNDSFFTLPPTDN